MKFTIPILLFLFIVSSCGQDVGVETDVVYSAKNSFLDSLPSTFAINSKTVALDTTFSKGFVKCEDIHSELNTLSGCIIRKGTKKFIRLYTITFDNNQHIDRLYRYTAMGADIISKEELLNDAKLFNYYNLSLKNEIKVDKKKKILIDNHDTMPIVDYWKNEKLIFVSNAKKLAKEETMIYGYNQ